MRSSLYAPKKPVKPKMWNPWPALRTSVDEIMCVDDEGQSSSFGLERWKEERLKASWPSVDTSSRIEQMRREVPWLPYLLALIVGIAIGHYLI
jgi:hypothetical protein